MFDFVKKIFSNEIKVTDKHEVKPTLKKDTELKKISSDFDDRVIKTKKILLEKFNSKPNNSDIYWSILQDLYIENFMKNKEMLLNIEYQRGLIRLKEKCFLDSISYFCNSLFYLNSLYPTIMNDNIDKNSILNKEKLRIFRKLSNAINNGFVTKNKFIKAFNHVIPDDIDNINFNDVLEYLCAKFDNNFIDENFINSFNFKEVKSEEFNLYSKKFKNLIDYYQKINDIKSLKKILETYYKFGLLHHDCWGNYGLSLGWIHDLITYKIKRFNEDSYTYTGKRIKYLRPIDYHNRFVKEYNDLSNNENRLDVGIFKYNELVKIDEFFKEEDYKLFDKYLL